MGIVKKAFEKAGKLLLPGVTGFAMTTARIFFSLKAYNTHYIPKNGAAIIVSNHPTYLDPPLLYVASYINQRRGIAFMAASWIFKIPILGPWLPLYGAYSVDKNLGKRNPFLKTLELLEQGELVGLFLEGTVSSGVLLNEELKSGPVRASLKTNIPIIPVTIIGGFRTWPMYKQWKFPRLKPVQIIFHEPFEPYKINNGNEFELIHKSNDVLRETINKPLNDYVSANYPDRKL